jgi:hypothetical protein
MQSCPSIQRHRDNKEARIITYAAAARPRGDQIDGVRLAACLTAALTNLATRQGDEATHLNDLSELVARNVSTFFKTNVKGAHVREMLAQAVKESQSRNHE